MNSADCLLDWLMDWFIGFCMHPYSDSSVAKEWSVIGSDPLPLNEQLQGKLNWLTRMMKALWSFLMSGTVYTTTHCHIPEDLNLQISTSAIWCCNVCVVIGFTGRDCETNINECMPNPCQHGGNCVDGINNYTCLCGRTGWVLELVL